MANSDSPFGLKPIRHRNGAPYNGAGNLYYIPSTYATALYIGDPVLVTGTSNTAAFQGHAPGTLPEINLATVGSYITGAIIGFLPAATPNLENKHHPASTEQIAIVADDPDLIFEVQEDGDTTPLAATSASNNADFIFTHSGSTATGLSGAELDSTTINTTNTLALRVLRMVAREDNEIGAWAKWEVAINLHSQRNATGV